MLSAMLLGLQVAAPSPATAKSAKAPVTSRATVVFLPSDDGLKNFVAAVEDFVEQAAKFYPDVKLMLAARIRRHIARRVTKCASNTACIAKLGKKQRLDEIIVVRVSAEGDGAKLQFAAVSVKEAKVARAVEITVASVSRVQTEMARIYFEVVGITRPGYLVIPGRPATLIVDGNEVPYNGKLLELPPGPHTVRVGAEETKIMVLPGESRKLELAAAVSAKGSSPEKAVLDPEPGTTVTDGGKPHAWGSASPSSEDEPASESSASAGVPLIGGVMSLAGIGLAGLGVVALGAAGYYGTQTEADISRSTPQLEARRRNRAARTAASRANVMFGVAGGAILAGAGLWAVDIFVLRGSPTASVNATPAADGVSIVVSGTF